MSVKIWAVRKKEVVVIGWLLGLGGASCSTSTVHLQSSPEKADIYVTAMGSGAPQKVGETPLMITSSDLLKAHGGSGPVDVEFRKEGYAPGKAIITDVGGMDLSINFELLTLPTVAASSKEDEKDPEKINKLNKMLDSLFESQRLAKAGRSEDALALLKEIEKGNPQLAAAYELEAGIYYLKKQYKQALDAYTLAARYNVKNLDSIRMRNMLEQSLGVTRQVAVAFPEGTAPTAAGAAQPLKQLVEKPVEQPVEKKEQPPKDPAKPDAGAKP